ncbi:MAG: VCBS repeat-containing protein [Pirellulaceae bacterium]|nr:VCBS repeat-containing protein [Planctomycetales bacterium]
MSNRLDPSIGIDRLPPCRSRQLRRRTRLGWWSIIACCYVSILLGCERPSPNSAPPQLAAQQATQPDIAPSIRHEAQEETVEFPCVADLSERLAPGNDSWSSETLSVQIETQLHHFADVLADLPRLTISELAQFSASGIDCPRLTGEATVVFSDESYTVTQSQFGGDDVTSGQGLNTLRQRIAELLSNFDAAHPRQVKFKLVGVSLEEQAIMSRQFLSIAGRVHNDSQDSKTAYLWQELTATWSIKWSRPTDGTLPKMEAIRVEQHEAVTLKRRAGKLFADCTESALANVAAYRDHLQYGIDYWLQRLESFLTDAYGQHGIAVADVNGDGLDDVYVCQPGGLANLLLIHQPDGTVLDHAAVAGVDLLDLSRAALFVDFDNDGDQDLALATISHVLFYSNDGAGNFQLRQQLPGLGDANSMASADADNDGDLDLYICVYAGDEGILRASPTPAPIHNAENGGHNAFFRNDIDATADEWLFVNATAEVGLDQHNQRWSYAASWEDYDLDGDVDLYVANDFGHNCFYRNDNGHFEDIAAQIGLRESAFGMGTTWADIDHDGHMDVYTSNMYSGAGNRVTMQPQFQPDAPDSVRQSLRFTAQGNTLFRNLGDGTFRNITADAGVSMGRWSWGSMFTDINNDGWDDILVSNGFVTRENTGDL